MVTDQDQNRPDEAARDDYTLSLRPVFQALWRRLWVVVLTVGVITGIAVTYSLSQTPLYQSSTKVLIGQDQGFTDVPGNAVGLEQMAATMAEAVDTPATAEAARKRLDFRIDSSQILAGLDAQQTPETQFIEITYTYTDPEKAQQIAQAAAEAFSEQVSETDPGADSVTATVWGQATPAFRVSPNLITDAFLALVASLFLGVGLAVLLEYLDDRWRLPPDETERVFGVPTLGIIPGGIAVARWRRKGGKLDETITEAYRTLATNLLHAFAGTPPKVIAVTSSGLHEGTSKTCASLGTGLREANKSVLVVDCNFRDPSIHKMFGLRNLLGTTDVLVNDRAPDALWHDIQPGLKVITAGPIPLNPTELFSSERFAKFVREMRDRFDYVLLDTPPVGMVSETVFLVTSSDGVLLVLDTQSTRKKFVWRSVRGLQTVGANFLGIVMNNVKASKASRYGYFYD